MGWACRLLFAGAERNPAKHAGIVSCGRFGVGHAPAFPGMESALVMMLDGLYSVSVPVSAGGDIYARLKPNGVWLIVELFTDELLKKTWFRYGALLAAGTKNDSVVIDQSPCRPWCHATLKSWFDLIAGQKNILLPRSKNKSAACSKRVPPWPYVSPSAGPCAAWSLNPI